MKVFLISSIRGYQYVSRMFLGLFTLAPIGGCRHLQTCSEFAIEAITNKGILRGSYQACIRVLQCNAFYVS
jgi:putative membrane protein insertion efficiency factor